MYVPSIINIKGGKTISIAVNDKSTNSHFASQPILGVVKSFTQCSDIPGPTWSSCLAGGVEMYWVTISLSLMAFTVLACDADLVPNEYYCIEP